MTVPLLAWVATLGALILLLLLDLFVAGRRNRPMGMRLAGTWSAVYLGAAAIFGLLLLVLRGGDSAAQYTTAYVVEESLSVDNLFVFVLVLSSFAVPKLQEGRVLLYGVVGALLLRAVVIAGGVAILDALEWVIYLFGAFLVITGIRLAFAGSEEPNVSDNKVVRLVQRVLPTTEYYVHGQLTTRVDGRRLFTPLAIVMVALAVTNVLFAVDSIPAVFGVTRDPFLIFTSNAFALIGLRSLYFLLAGAVRRLVYLNYGLAAILTFVGAKMIAESVITVPTWLSLLVIGGLLALTIAASLLLAGRPADDPEIVTGPG
ncbi:MAG: TerC/Alx family metal homeostasis membrane protein [Frankiaceae bacterium]